MFQVLKMSDDEVERFEITDHDLDNEFNFGLRRPRMSKNQVWSLLQFSFVCFFNPATRYPSSFRRKDGVLLVSISVWKRPL